MPLALELGWRSLRRRPGRWVGPVVVGAAATLVVLVTTGFYVGLLAATVAWLRSLPGDLVVAVAGGNPGLMQAYSDLQPETVDAVRAVDGVAAVHPLYGQRVWLSHGGQDAWAYVVGIHPYETFGLPVHVVAGRARPRIGEIVVDVVVAHDLRVGVGDTVRVRAATLRVVGVATGGNNVIGSYAFVSRATLALAGLLHPTHLFVDAAPGRDVGAVAAGLAAVPDVQVLSRPEFEARNLAFPRQVFLPIVGVIDATGVLVAIVMIAAVLHAGSVERRAEYGLFDALGIPRRTVAGTVLFGTLLATGVGVALGTALGVAIAAVAPAILPRFVCAMPLWLLLGSATTALAVGLIAAVRPVRAAMATDPAIVFRV